jgi:hypothetical protein
MHDVEAKQTATIYYRNYIYRFNIRGCESGKSPAEPRDSAEHSLNTSLYVTSNLFTLTVG